MTLGRLCSSRSIIVTGFYYSHQGEIQVTGAGVLNMFQIFTTKWLYPPFLLEVSSYKMPINNAAVSRGARTREKDS